jgi:hypothetical protein
MIASFAVLERWVHANFIMINKLLAIIKQINKAHDIILKLLKENAF